MTPTSAQLEVVFWGHACVGIHLDDQPFLLIDPFDPAGLGSIAGPPTIPLEYRYVIATHDHSDHAAFHTQPQAKILHANPAAPLLLPDDPLEIHARRVAHDEFGGRLRGGATLILDLRIAGLRILHCGDLGERLHGPVLDWLSAPRPDLLIVPAGGYFTLGADGAAALAAAVNPRHVLFCHTSDDGLPLPQMASRQVIRQRTAAWSCKTTSSLRLSGHAGDASSEAGVTVVWLTRPDGMTLNSGGLDG